MDIVLGFIFGAAGGIFLHLLLPYHGTRGILLAPMIGACISGIAWASLTWLGLGTNNALLWIVPIFLPLFALIPFILVLSEQRIKQDRQLRKKLGLA